MKLMVVHAQYSAPALQQRQQHVLEVASSGTRIEFSEISGELFKLTGNTEVLRMLAGTQVVEKAKEAERRGFDAVVPFGGLDLGVDAARSYVDIPVVGMGRSGLCIAANLATRIAVIVYGNSNVPAVRKLIREVGFADFVCTVTRVNLHIREMTPDNSRFRQVLVDESKRIVSNHNVEVIVPLGTSFLPTNAFAREVSAEVGVPFVNCVAAGVKTAEMLIGMGLKNSRKAYPLDG